MTSFFVTESGKVAQPSEVAGWASDDAAPRWGHEQRTCDACGSEWGQFGCTKAGCTSVVFTARYVEPIPFMTGIRDKIAPKKALPRATATQLSDLRGLQSTARQLLDDLRRTDAALIGSIRGDVEELIPAQGYVHRSLAIIGGDRSPQNIDGLGLGLESLADFLGVAIKTLEEPK